MAGVRADASVVRVRADCSGRGVGSDADGLERRLTSPVTGKREIGPHFDLEGVVVNV